MIWACVRAKPDRGSGAPVAQCYLNYNMAGRMAAIPGVAVIDLQAQSLEGDPGTAFNSPGSYWNFVDQATAQAQAGATSAGKSIVILSGLSTDPNVSPAPSLCNIEQSANNVQPSLVSGFWMNVPNGNSGERPWQSAPRPASTLLLSRASLARDRPVWGVSAIDVSNMRVPLTSRSH
jgi:hypothetical protein